MFFHLRPHTAILSDTNGDLIDTYRAIRSRRKLVQRRLERHHGEHAINPDRYYDVRAKIPDSIDARAARFIYLNRTCFNGIYRVNRAGQFNVPRGDKQQVLLPNDTWEEWSRSLRSAELFNYDFERIIDQAEKGDFLFVDPPYTIHHNLNGFIKYNEVLFSWEDQVRLAHALDRARKRRVRILMTNANHECIHFLYGRGFQQSVVYRFSSISAKTSGRSSYEELIITTK